MPYSKKSFSFQDFWNSVLLCTILSTLKIGWSTSLWQIKLQIQLQNCFESIVVQYSGYWFAFKRSRTFINCWPWEKTQHTEREIDGRKKSIIIRGHHFLQSYLHITTWLQWIRKSMFLELCITFSYHWLMIIKPMRLKPF